MSTGYAAKFRVYRVVAGNKAKDPASRERGRAAMASSPGNPDNLASPASRGNQGSTVRLRAANKAATSRLAVSRAMGPADVRLGNEAFTAATGEIAETSETTPREAVGAA
jgi:hypothetical protein